MESAVEPEAHVEADVGGSVMALGDSLDQLQATAAGVVSARSRARSLGAGDALPPGLGTLREDDSSAALALRDTVVSSSPRAKAASSVWDHGRPLQLLPSYLNHTYAQPTHEQYFEATVLKVAARVAEERAQRHALSPARSAENRVRLREDVKRRRASKDVHRTVPELINLAKLPDIQTRRHAMRRAHMREQAVLTRTQQLLRDHPEAHAEQHERKLTMLQQRIDAEDFNSRSRQRLGEFWRKQALFSGQLDRAVQDMYM